MFDRDPYDGHRRNHRRYGRLFAAGRVLLLGLTAAGLLFRSGAPAENLDDCALLYDSADVRCSDINFQKICQFYGLRCREIDLGSIELSDSLLQDALGRPLAAIAIDLQTLEGGDPALVDSLELSRLKAVVTNGANLLLSGFAPGDHDFSATRRLTDSLAIGCKPTFHNLNWTITSARPEITREFSGHSIPYQGGESARSPILQGSADTLISSLDRDHPQSEYPVFAVLPLGSGTVFIDGCRQTLGLDQIPIRDLYYCYDHFHQIVPTMMFVRFAGGRKCWHHDQNYANLTIDDPPLSGMQYGSLNFQDLLAEMKAHQFHTTIGMVPVHYNTSDEEVVELFRNAPDYYSIVQHGNNHDGFEFFAYDSAGSLDVCLERGWCGYPPRPFAQQEADIVEGLARMAEFGHHTGLPHDRVMIFPFGIAPAPTLELLKAYNFTATVNGLSIPIGEQSGQNDDFNMRPADLSFANFASCPRRHWLNEKLYLYDLFIDMPALFYEHQGFFENGPGAFNEAADAVNTVAGTVEWLGLGDICRRLYLQKTNDDSTISVRLFTSRALLTNTSADEQRYRITKEEALNLPLQQVTIDGEPADYSLLGDTLRIETTIAAGASIALAIGYGSGEKDFAISPEDIQFDQQDGDTVIVTVHNLGPQGGPVAVQFYDGHPDSGGIPLDLTVTERIEPSACGTVRRSLAGSLSGAQRISIVLDPHNIIPETDEENNLASIDVGVSPALVIDDFEYDDSPLDHGWEIDSGDGQLRVAYDSTLQSRVLQAVTEQGTDFRISHTAHDSPKPHLLLKLKADAFFILYVRVQTTAGDYYLQYTPDDGEDSVSGEYIYVHIGENHLDSQWHLIERDLAADLAAHVEAELSRVKFFVLRGAYLCDDLCLSQPCTLVPDDTGAEHRTPGRCSLLNNYPNPFNAATTLNFFLGQSCSVELCIYNTLGQRVNTLASGRRLPGLHIVIWEGDNDSGAPVTSGIYFAVLRAGGHYESKKMVLLH